MKWQEKDALADLDDAIEDVYAAALLLRAAKRAAFADELHHTAEILFSVRKRLRESS